ncbi:hypothetical protein AKO1_012607, partial [Acrasis kona]
MCAYNKNTSPCSGDSGAPVVIKPKNHSRYVAVGLDSYGASSTCGEDTTGTVLSMLSSMTSFIAEQTTLAPPTFVTVTYTTSTKDASANNSSVVYQTPSPVTVV